MKFENGDKVFKLEKSGLNLIFNYFHKKSNMQKFLLIKTIVNVTEKFCTYAKDIDFTRFVSGSDSFKVYSQNGHNGDGDFIFNFKSEEDIEKLKNIIEKHYQEKDLEAQKEDERIIQQNIKKIKELEQENKIISERKRKYFGTHIIVKEFLDTTKTELLLLIEKEKCNL